MGFYFLGAGGPNEPLKAGGRREVVNNDEPAAGAENCKKQTPLKFNKKTEEPAAGADNF